MYFCFIASTCTDFYLPAAPAVENYTLYALLSPLIHILYILFVVIIITVVIINISLLPPVHQRWEDAISGQTPLGFRCACKKKVCLTFNKILDHPKL